MKTTVEISDNLMSEARSLVNKQGTTFRELLEAGLLKEVRERKKEPAQAGYKLPDRRKSGGVRPGIDLSDWRSIREIIYEPHLPSDG